MRAVGWLFVGLSAVFGVAALSLGFAGVSDPVRALVVGGCACLAIAAPALITACELTAGNVGDAQAGPMLLAGESSGLEVLADSAYGSGQHRAHLLAAHHVAVIKAIPLRETIPGGFSIDDFVIDLTSRIATCPAGQTVPINGSGSAKFGPRCRACVLPSRCTATRHGRDLTIHPHFALMAAARRQPETESFQRTYTQWRPMVERSLAWLVRKGNRRVAYRGIERNRIWLSHRVAAVDLGRLLNLGLSRNPDGWTVA